MSNSSIWPIDRTLSGATPPDQSGPRSVGYSAFPKTPHYWNLTIRLFNVLSRTLVDWRSYPSVEMQLVYSTAPAYWAEKVVKEAEVSSIGRAVSWCFREPRFHCTSWLGKNLNNKLSFPKRNNWFQNIIYKKKNSKVVWIIELFFFVEVD